MFFLHVSGSNSPAPFCIHTKYQLNPTQPKLSLGDDSTRYDANSPGDLPVLTRYFPAEAVRHLTPKAKFL